MSCSIVPAYQSKSKGTKFTYHINNQRGFIIKSSLAIIKTKQAVFPWKLKMGKKYNNNTDFHACMNQITRD